MNNDIFSKVIYPIYKNDKNQEPFFSSNNSFKNLIQLIDNNQSFLNEKKKKKNVPNIKNQLIHKSQSALNIKSYNKNKNSNNKEKENNILIQNYNYKKNLGKINNEYNKFLNYIYYPNKNHKSRAKHNEKPKIHNNDKDSETNFSTTLKSNKKESNKEKLKERNNFSNTKQNKSNKNLKYYKQDIEMPIKLIDYNFNKYISKRSNNKKINNNLNNISKSNEILSFKKNKNIKNNSNKRGKLNKNFSEYFDDIIDLFKNSISSEKLSKNKSIININSSNSINSLAENLIKINKKVSKNQPINYGYDNLFDENSFYNCKDILISLSDDDIKKNCKSSRESNKIISENNINNILFLFNSNKINNKKKNKRISRSSSQKSVLKTTKSESGFKFNSINSYKYINLSNKNKKYDNYNKNNTVKFNKTSKNDDKYIYNNNIYDFSNSNISKMKNQKASSINKKIKNYNDIISYSYNKINFSNHLNFPSSSDLLLHNYLILTKSKFN